MNIKLDKNVPVPENGIIKSYREVIKKMKVGESFEYPSKHYTNVNLCTTAHKAANESIEFMSKGITHDTRRLWRIK